jgi:iron(III) transport system ATP-binding protein
VSLLELAGVTRRYHPAQPPAVDAVSLAVSPGEILALLGPSGSGKTTILRLIAGFEVPDAGVITIAGRVMSDATAPAGAVPPEARGVGIVFQDYALFPHLTVDGNVGFGVRRTDGDAARARTREVLALAGLGHLAGRYPHELSGGQQQLVAVARALAPAPAVLLLDEPFSNLDTDLRAQMRVDVEKVLRATRTTAIFVTHGQEEAFAMADRVGVLHRGRVEQVDTPEDIYHRPATRFVAEFVGAASFVPGIVTRGTIVTAVGMFVHASAEKDGDTVDVMIRPDDVAFTEGNGGDAVVVEREFRGTETRYLLALDSGVRLTSDQPSWATTRAGVRVRVTVRLRHVVVFPAITGTAL